MKRAVYSLFVAWVVLGANGARSDERANVNPRGAKFTATGGAATLVLDATGERAEVKASGRRYTIELGRDRAENGDFHLSPDGRSVLFLRKAAFVGRMLDDPRAQGLRPAPVEGLALWRNGKLLTSRNWEALLTRRTLFGRSVSHLHWLLETTVDWKKNEATLVTTSFRRYRIGLVDGRFLEESDLPSFSAAPRIAYGIVRADGGKEVLDVLRWDKGSGSTRVEVRRDAGSPNLGRDAFWVVPEPEGGIATIREFVDEVSAARRASSASARSAATKYFARLLSGTRASLAGEQVEFRPSGEDDGALVVDFREPVAGSDRLYEATVLVPVRLNKEKRDPLIAFVEKGLVYEPGRWHPVRVRSDAKGPAAAGASRALDGTLLFRSPSRADLIEVRLVENPYQETHLGRGAGRTFETVLGSPPGPGLYRWVE